MDEIAQEIELDIDFQKDERIFHYTTAQGLAGILQSNCIWATHFLALNDRQEFRAARDSMAAFVGQRMAERLAALKINKLILQTPGTPPLRDVASEQGAHFVDSLYAAMFATQQPFVFSGFVCDRSKKDEFQNGVLQHWATYGSAGGFAIQINPHILANVLHAQEERFEGDVWSTGKVDYSKGIEPPQSLRPYYDDLGRQAQIAAEMGLLKPEEKIDIAKTIQPFIRIASYLKHNFFAIEHEARLVIMRTTPIIEGLMPHALFLRSCGHDLISYVKVLEDRFVTTPGLVERIIVGPGGDRERRCECIKEYLNARHLLIDIQASEIPYIPH